ncbi:hypothetical protein EMPS_08389, partial [Entomortierella parvispora]
PLCFNDGVIATGYNKGT